MNLTYLGHAGFCVETEEAMVVMDPWLSPHGAFDSAWFQLPRNHHLAPHLIEKLRDSKKARYVYISHEHKDHFDPDFLQGLPNSELTYVLPKFHRTAVRAKIEEFHPKSVVMAVDDQAVLIPGGSLKLYLEDSGINRDSAILVRSGRDVFLNLNDCKVYDRLCAIVREEGPIDTLAGQFSGATWHPICYDYPREEYDRISCHKMMSKFETVARAIETAQPTTFLPSAGPPCFLDPSLMHLNFEPVSVFPRTASFLTFLRKRLSSSAINMFEIFPGDEVDAQSGCRKVEGTERFTELEFENYVRSYAAEYQEYFAASQARRGAEELHCVLERLAKEIGQKLDAFSLCDRVGVPLYFGLADLKTSLLRIDFPNRKVEEVGCISDPDYYSIQAPSWQIARVLDGAISWEEFALTFRMRLNRRPDVYQTLIQGFLLMEPEDMNWFCAQVLAIEERQKRVVVEAGGTRYSMDRYCPHQGADLSQGWLDQGRLWVCPRHRWQFALDKGGLCLTSNASIHALCLEGE